MKIEHRERNKGIHSFTSSPIYATLFYIWKSDDGESRYIVFLQRAPLIPKGGSCEGRKEDILNMASEQRTESKGWFWQALVRLRQGSPVTATGYGSTRRGSYREVRTK